MDTTDFSKYSTEEQTKEVEKDTPLKEWLVDYVGSKLQPADKNVTVEMVVKVLSEEFPEFLLVIAEENFLRGYQQALVDVDTLDGTEK